MFEFKDDKKENLTSMLLNLSNVEDEAFDFFSKLASLTEKPEMKKKFNEIASDSKKHAIAFRKVGSQIGDVVVKNKQCQKMMESISSVFKKAHKEIEEKTSITNEELLRIAHILDKSSVEEYFMQVQTKTLQLLANKIGSSYKVEFEGYQDMFMGISREEENHRAIIENVIEELESPTKIGVKSS
ncbi:MAG: hypothetical protein ACQCN3_12985 [Candidatus Bathyarchaeia archaeon]|jgi:rubrerythrin